MSLATQVTGGLRALLRKRQVESELDEELTSFVASLTEERMRAGMSEAEARRAAWLEVGGLDAIKEKVRAAGWEATFGALCQDAGFGLRMLRKAPAFTVTAVLTLALGIGANASLFNLVAALLLRPLPVQDAGRLAVLTFQKQGGPLQDNFAAAQYTDIRNQTKGIFSALVGHQEGSDGMGGDGRVERVPTDYVTGSYFAELGVRPALGRLITPAEGAVAGADPVVVLGYSYWQSRFGGDRGVVGRKLAVNGHPATIIGVAPRGFHGVRALTDPRAYMPLAMAAPWEGFGTDFLTNRGIRNIELLARLRSGVGLEQARAVLGVVGARLGRQFPASDGGLRISLLPETLARPTPQSGGQLARAARIFLLLAALVLLLSSVNVANIALVRATVRRREMTIRAALGAGRRRLLRQLFIESCLLAAAGGAGGVLLASCCSAALAVLPLSAHGAPLALDLSFDWRVFAYAAAAAILSAAIVTWAPALQATSTNLAVALGSGGRGATAGSDRLRNGLVAAQIAAALTILIVAGIFARSLALAQRERFGFDPAGVLDFTLDPAAGGLAEAAARDLYRRLLERASQLPGAESACLAAALPMGETYYENTLQVPGYLPPPGQPAPLVDYDIVSAGYFATLRIPRISGRAFDDVSDGDARRPVAMVNRTMAARFWPRGAAVGASFAMASHADRVFRVVGVVEDSRAVGTTGAIEPFFYLPLAQQFASEEVLQIRTSQPPEVMIPLVRRLLADLAPGLPIWSAGTLEDALGGMRGFLPFKIAAGLAAGLGLLALILALVGVYGVVSYSARQRQREIGIRMALGAERRAVVRLVLREGLAIVGLGVVAGGLASLVAAPSLGRLATVVTTSDPWPYAAATAGVVASALAACYLPARRMARLDPTQVLRGD